MRIKEYKLIFLLIGLMLFTSCNYQNKSGIDWDSDLDYIQKELPQRHCNFFTLKSKKEFVEGLEKIKEKKRTGIDYALNLQQVVASFGDSHTRVSWEQLIDRKQVLPLNMYWFEEGIYVLHTTEEYKEILGNQILSINQIPIQSIVDSLSTLITVDNQALVKSTIPKLLSFVQVFRYFGFVKNNTVELESRDARGETKLHQIKPAQMSRGNRIVFRPDSLAICYRNERKFFIDYYQKKDEIYYLQYNKCSGREREIMFGRKDADKLPLFEDFTNRAFHVLKNKEVKKLVFDMRFNTGGGSAQGTEFISRLAEYSKQNSDVKLYVVLGRKTFSSAIINAMDFKRMTNAVFVGEETGGKPNHFGEILDFKLPKSGLTVLYSTKYFKESDEEVNSLQPDIQLPLSFKDFKNGIDPVYEWIRNQD